MVKTFAWNKWLDDGIANRQIGLMRYSYVSLFGINSPDDLKQVIFQNTIATSLIGQQTSLETLKQDPFDVGRTLGRKWSGFLGELPFTKAYAQSMQSVAFFSGKETIICLDDLKRRGDKPSDKDFMELVS